MNSITLSLSRLMAFYLWFCCIACALCPLATAAPATEPAVPRPVYPVAYTTPTTETISQTLRRVRERIENGSILSIAASGTELDRGPERIFPPISYQMSLIYIGMLSAADATGDHAFSDFDVARFQFFADNLARIESAGVTDVDRTRGPFRYLLAPQSIDTFGDLGAVLIKAKRQGLGPDFKSLIERFAECVNHQQVRLSDGAIARNRPVKNSVWADDLYMSVPMLAELAVLTGQSSYFDDAANQVVLYNSRLFVPSRGLFTHGVNADNPVSQPKYFWARANGWCMMAMVELLDTLPADHPQRSNILRMLRAHAEGVATCQSGTGLWHQMLDRPDSFLETSASAMFTYSLARSINRGWLDAAAYGPVAQAGWNGVANKISADGHVSGTCVGTTYAADYSYYYNRPTADDALGYGPVLLAGSEMIHLLSNPHITIQNDGRGGACHYLPHD